MAITRATRRGGGIRRRWGWCMLRRGRRGGSERLSATWLGARRVTITGTIGSSRRRTISWTRISIRGWRVGWGWMLTAIRMEVMPDPSLRQGGPGRSPESGNFVLTNVEAEAVSMADAKIVKKIKFGAADATYSQEGHAVELAIDGDAKTGWAVWKT